MIKFTTILLAIIAIILFSVRFALSASPFLSSGVMDGLRTCKVDSDCTWVDTECCGCHEGSGEILLNKDKEWMYKLLFKPLCLEEQVCRGENICHDQQVFCDRSCKFGEREYTKPLLFK